MNISTNDVKEFWEKNPLCASGIPFPLGSFEYFQFYNALRERNEPTDFFNDLHETFSFSGKKVLDVGCGNGYVLEKYARNGAKVVGIDLTRAGVRLSKARFDQAKLPGTFVQGNAESLPFSSETFDCACSMGVLHHTPDTKKGIAEIYRVLKPGGRLIVMFYYRYSALMLLRFPLESFLTGKPIPQLLNEVDGVGNPKGSVFSKNELKRLLSRFEDIRFQVNLLQNWMVFPRGGRFVPESLLKPFSRKLGWFLYAKARKPKPK